MSTWAEIVNRVPVNLQNSISKDMTKDLKPKEGKIYINSVEPQAEYDISPESLDDETSKLDAEIAKRLQQQFDKEYEGNFNRVQGKLNGSSKVSVSYSNYHRVPNNFDFETEDGEEDVKMEDSRDCKDWDRLEVLLKETRFIPRGYVMKNGRIITKRDVMIDNREHAGVDLKICNKVLKRLKIKHKILDNKEDRATAAVNIDDATRHLLYKMISTQLIENVTGVINRGKEKIILHANSGPEYATCGSQREWAIKIFVTTQSEYKYINDHHCFKDRYGKKNIHKIVDLWVEKEMHNLLSLKKAGIPCPEVVGRKRHILITSFIGRNGRPAPTLSNAPMNELQYTIAYNQVIEQMKILYNEANLIHIDLSEHKILWFDEKCYFYDLSEAVEPTHQRSYHWLRNGCENITKFFKCKGVPKLLKIYELLEYISNTDYRTYFTRGYLKEPDNLPAMKSRYTFDKAWKKSRMGELHFGGVHKT